MRDLEFYPSSRQFGPDRCNRCGKFSSARICWECTMIMNNPLVDVVDENGKFLYTTSRKIAHKDNLLHQSVHIILTKPDGRVGLQLRKSTKGSYPLHWGSSVAGHVDSGETPETSAFREMKEEIGVDHPLQFRGVYHVRDWLENELVYIYLCEGYDGEFTLEEREMEAFVFFPPEMLNILSPVTPSCKKALSVIYPNLKFL